MNEIVLTTLRASVAAANSSIASLIAEKTRLEAALALVNATLAQEIERRDSILDVLPEEEAPDV